MKKRYTPFFITLVCGLLLGALAGYGFSARTKGSAASASLVVRENSPEYKFINPILLSQSTSNTDSPEFSSLKSKIDSYVDDSERAGNATSISVYFRNMNSGRSTGVNETATYAPGSMLKVAIMMGYLAAQDEDPNLLDTKFHYSPEIDEGQYFKPAKMLAQGDYTARDLIKNMIIESDNTATLILANAHTPIVEKVYTDLKLPDPEAGVDFMSPKDYSLLWRVLYNATYLPRSISEEALDLLSFTTFNDGLVAGLPPNTRIAHKFGEHTDVSSDKPAVHELHDCGIIYPPTGDPYFLCVMTRGSDFKPLETIISDISKMVYANSTK